MQLTRERILARITEAGLRLIYSLSSMTSPSQQASDERPHRLTGFLFGQESAAWIVPVLRPHYRPVVVLAVITTLASLLGLVVPYCTKLIIDEALLPGDFQALLYYTALLFLTGIFALLIGVFNSMLHLRFSIRLLNDLRKFLVQKVLAMTVQQHARQRVGEILGRIDGDASQLQRFAFDALLSGGGAIVRLIGSVGFMLWLDWRLTLVVILAAPAELLFLIWARPGTRERANEVREQRGLLASLLGETIASVPVLQSVVAEQKRFNSFVDRQSNLTQSLIRQRFWSEWIGFVPALLSALVRGSILLYGGFRVISGEMQLGSLIAFLSYLGFMLGPMRTLLGIYHAQARVKAAIARLDLLAYSDSIPLHAVVPRVLPRDCASLEFNNISFTWPDKNEPVLQFKQLCIAPGSKFLLTGGSGSGKSTLCSMVGRFNEPDSGEVLYNNIPVSQYDLNDLRNMLVLVPQDGFLFHGSIFENLKLSRDDLTEEQAWYYLRIVELDQWVMEQGGLHVPIGERALNISGGQKQRLSVARALILPFQVIVFDESLSQVDAETIQKVITNIDNAFPETTRIYVAHGNESIYHPIDRIVHFDQVNSA